VRSVLHRYDVGKHIVATVVIVLVVVSGLATTVTAAPTLDVRIEGSSVGDGDRVTVTEDPLVRVEGSTDAPVESVEIRVGGETRHTFQPDETSFSERVTLDIDDGEHELTVVADGDGTTEWTATVWKDSDGPRVTYTSPFSGRGQPSGTVFLDAADTTLAADLSDESGVERVRIERDYEWTFGGRSRRDLRTYRISDPGENVSRRLLFGLGENSLAVEVRDVHGQRTTHDITVRVGDPERPSIDLDRFERSGGTLGIAGVVEDNVKVRSLDVRIGSGRKSVLTETSAEPTRERLSVPFESTVRLTGDIEEVTLIATDVAGNTREWTLPVDYRGHIVPTVDIDEEATRVDGEAVAVSGAVTDGRVDRVVVETVGRDGDTVSTTTVHEGGTTDRVDVRTRLRRADGPTTVVVRAIDVDGREHEGTLTLDAVEATAAATTTPSTAAPSTPATTTPSTPVATTAVADVNDDAAAGGGTGLPRLPFPTSNAVVVAVVVVGLAMALGIVTKVARDGTATGGGSDGTATGGDRSNVDRNAASPVDDPSTETGERWSTETDAGGQPDGDGDPDESVTAGGDGADGPEGDTDTDAGSASEVDVTDRLGVASVAEVGSDEVDALAADLDDDDAAVVADATRWLAAVADERPELIAGTTVEYRLRDLRHEPDPAVSEHAKTAMRRLSDTEE
jgi:hypothetical protein